MTAVLVFLGAVVGAPARYLTDRAVQNRHDSPFPWGTLSVNAVGSLILGGLSGTGTAASSPVMALVGVGFCGALTTFSTFSYETIRLAEEHAYFYAAANIVASVLAAVGAAFLGYGAVQVLVA